MSKLYTKEMFLIASEKCEVSMIDANHIMQYIDEYVNPMELPTEEEVQQYLKSFPYTKHLDDGQYNDGVIVGAELAIEWMRNKIKGGNNE
jgi:hypothetical protein